MAGRGRGRASLSFNVELLGIGRGETFASILQPPPVFPPLQNHPLNLQKGEEFEYILALKQEFRNAMQNSPYYMNYTEKTKDIERYSDKYQFQHQQESSFWEPDWHTLPSELKEKKVKKTKTSKLFAHHYYTSSMPEEDLEKAVKNLDKNRNFQDAEDDDGQKSDGEESVTKEKEDNEDLEEELEDEELDDGGDYNLNYFDNGEGFEDDDDMDEGGTY